MKATMSFILVGLLLIGCSEPVQDDSKDGAKEKAAKEAEIEKNNIEKIDLLPTHRFRSTETGVEEYMTMRQNVEGEKEWFYFICFKPERCEIRRYFEKWKTRRIFYEQTASFVCSRFR